LGGVGGWAQACEEDHGGENDPCKFPALGHSEVPWLARLMNTRNRESEFQLRRPSTHFLALAQIERSFADGAIRT
jgi:hypothetical protein